MSTVIIRDDTGAVSQALSVHQIVHRQFGGAREFTVMQVMAALNVQLSPSERLTVTQVSKALERLARADERVVRVVAGRYTWWWAREEARP